MTEWKDGTVEEVDIVESEAEAIQLVSEYQMAFKDSYKRIWFQL